MAEQLPVRKLVQRLRSLVRSRTSLASIGIFVAAIFFASMGTTAWWAIRSQTQSLKQGRLEQVASIGHVLSQTAEIMMANNELSAVRRIVSETSQTYNLKHCRIVLPSGQVVADTDPKQITLADLPATWMGSVPGQRGQTLETGQGKEGLVTEVFDLRMPGRGEAALMITAPIDPEASSSWPLQVKIGTISVGALIALLLLHRNMRMRVRAIFAVRQILLEQDLERMSLAAMEVDPRWGREAQAWNNLIRQTEQQREQLAMRQAGESLQNRRANDSDLNAACNALWQGLILVDKDLRAKYVNGAAAVLLQTDIQKILDTDVTGVLNNQEVLDAIRTAIDQPMCRRTIVEVEQAGEHATSVLRFVVRPVRREDPGVVMIVVEDVTQQRIADKSRGAFIANATHELRTPLTNIRLYVETALDEGARDAAVQADCLNVINQEAHRLERMVADVLSVAQIEAGTLQLKRDDVNLGQIFGDLEHDYVLQAKDKEIELAFDLPPNLPVIQADRDKVIAGLHNLLSNALKYTPAGGKVTVAVAVEPRQIVVEVTDTGIGISDEDTGRIFEKFYRAHDRRVLDVSGSGLGLAIAREVIRLHGGDITVQSEPDKGSTFTLVLPTNLEAA